MAAEIWILLIVLASAAAAAAGFFYARRTAPTKAEVEALREELETSQQKAEKVQADVAGHFEQSAVLFGRLAHDYRAFLEHFSESARELGISDTMARELLQRADQPLLGSDSDVVDTQRREDESADNSSTGVNRSAESQYSEGASVEDTREESNEDTHENISVETTLDDQANIQQPAVDTTSVKSAESDTEPPLIDDVFVSRSVNSNAETESEEAHPTTGKVVDVELNPVEKAGEEETSTTATGSAKDTRRHG